MTLQTISAQVKGGPSGGSSMRRPGSEDPHPDEQKFGVCTVCKLFCNEGDVVQVSAPYTLSLFIKLLSRLLYISLLTHQFQVIEYYLTRFSHNIWCLNQFYCFTHLQCVQKSRLKSV